MSAETIATLTRERDSYQRQLDAIGDALVTSVVKRIEPRLSRHPVTVIMAAGALFFKIGEAIGCEFEDGDDLLEAVKELVRERDEARADAERYLADLRRCASEPYEHAKERDEAFRRGAEAMREACAQECREQAHTESMLECVEYIRALPIPEEP